jgi:excisionase family DNA binding protein
MKELSVIQVAEILKCTPRTVINLIKRGAFPNAYKLDPNAKSVYRIPKSDVDKLIKQRATK